MTQPIQEPLVQRSISQLTWGSNQLFRRPDPNASSPIIALRATYDPSGGLTVATDTETIINWDTWENEDTSIFEEVLVAGDLQTVRLIAIGVYSITVGILWETAFTSPTEIDILDQSNASSGFFNNAGMCGMFPRAEGGSQFTYATTFTAIRKYPLLGVTDGDITGSPPIYGSWLVKVAQWSGISRDLEGAWMDCFYWGPTADSSIPT